MNTEVRLQEIITRLKEFKESVERGFNQISELETPEIQEKIQHFREIEISKVSKKVEQAIRVLDAPIYVGLLGRYSHGKTALINQFFSVGEEYSLPEGEGVVTSKITLIAFDSKVGSPRCSQVLRDKTEHRITIETLKASVREKVADANAAVTDYYSIKLPTREPFSRLFEDEKIHLIDMPGLGSPYEKDTQKVIKIMEHIDLLIVAVKITEIDERAGNAIERYIRNNLSIQIIPVLTFFDKWKECDDFVTCPDEEAVVIKAKQLVEAVIPSLSNHLIRAVAVSSKTRFNIVELRECVLNFVKEQNIGIDKAKQEIPEITKRKFSEVSRELDRLVIDTESSLTKLQGEIKSLLPSSQSTQNGLDPFEKTFRRQKNKFVTQATRKISRSVRDIFSDFRTVVQDIRYQTNYNEVRDRISAIEQQVNSKKSAELQNDVDNLVKEFKAILSDAVVSYVDQLDISESKRQQEKEDAIDLIENSVENLFQNLDKPFEAQSIVRDIVQDLMKSTFDFFTDNLTNPQLLVPLSLPLITLPLTFALNKIPFGWGEGVSAAIISLVDSALIIFAVVFVLRVISSDRTKQFTAAKNNIIDKLVASFDKYKQEILNYSCENFVKSTDRVINDVNEALQPVTDDYSKDVKEIAQTVKDFQLKVTGINRFLQQQIEIFESEQL